MTNTPRKKRFSRLTLALMATSALALVAAAGCAKDEKKPAKGTPTKVTKAPATDKTAMKPGDMKHGDMKHGDMKPGDMKHGDMNHGEMNGAGMDHAKMKGGRVVAIKVDAKGFSPDSVPAKPGEHLKLVFTRTTEEGCGTEVVLATTGKKYELPLNKPVDVHLMAGKSGSIGFACGMNMMKGAVVVQ